MPSEEALSLQQDIKSKATASTLNQMGAEEKLAIIELNELTEELNAKKEKSVELDGLAVEQIQNQKKLIEQLNSEKSKLNDFEKKIKATAESTGKSIKDVIKDQQKELEIKKKSIGLSKDEVSFLEKKLKLTKEIADIEKKRTYEAGKAAASTSASQTGRVTSGLVGGPQATVAMLGGLVGSLATALGSLAGPIGGAIGGAVGPVLGAMITLAFWNIEKKYESMNKGLLLSTAMGGKTATGFSVLGSGYLTSGEYGGLAEKYSKSGLHGRGLIDRGIGGFTGLEALGGLEKVTGDAASVQKMAEAFSAITKGNTYETTARIGAIWQDIQGYTEGTGIAAQKVFGWMSQISEQAQYLNVDYKLLSFSMEKMVENQKQFASIGINVAKDGGRIMENIMNLPSTMSMENIAGLAALRNPNAKPFETIASRKYGANYANNISFSGRGESFKMNLKNQGELEGGAIIETQKDIKNLFSELTKGLNLDSEEGKAQALATITLASKQFGISEEAVKVLLSQENYDKLSLEDQKKLEKSMKSPQQKMQTSLENIEKGLVQGMKFDKIAETWMQMLANIGIVKSFTTLIEKGMYAVIKFAGGMSDYDITKQALGNKDLSTAVNIFKENKGKDTGIFQVILDYLKKEGASQEKINALWDLNKNMQGMSGYSKPDEYMKTLKSHSGGTSSFGIGQMGETFSPGEFKFKTNEPVRIMSVSQSNALAAGGGKGGQTININISSGGIVAERGVVEALKGIFSRGMV